MSNGLSISYALSYSVLSTTLWARPIIPSNKETEAKWKAASKMTPIILSSWNSCPRIVSSIVNQSWPVWPITQRGRDHVWLWKLHHEMYRTCHFGLLDHWLWGNQLPYYEGVQVPCGEPQLTSNGSLMKDWQPESPAGLLPGSPFTETAHFSVFPIGLNPHCSWW